MFKKIILFFLLMSNPVFAGTTINPITGKQDFCITLEEEDGSPSNITCFKTKVTNGTMTDNGDGTYSLNVGSVTNNTTITAEWTDLGTILYPTELADDVAIGTSTSLGKTTILLTDNEAGLVIRQTTGQTADVLVVEKQDGTDIWTVATGGVKVTGALNVTGEVDLDNFSNCTLKTGAGGDLICGTDSGVSVTAQESDATVDSAMDTIDFGSGFDLTSSPAGEVNVSLDFTEVAGHDNFTDFVANEHIDHTSVTLTAGAGLSGGGDISANRSFATDSTETDFLASGALTCGAGTRGKMQIHTTPLQYCDNAATPTLRYSAYANSIGSASELAGMTTNGIPAKTSAGNFASRVMTAGSNGGLTITNGNGVSGSPTFSLSTSAALSGDHSLSANAAIFGQNGIIFEGATANTIELYLAIPDPASTDKTITFPNATTTLVGKDTTDIFTNKDFNANATGNSLSNVETADISSGSKTGSDTTLVTGTAGGSGICAEWNADGDLVEAASGLACGSGGGGSGGSSEWTDEGDDLRPNELSDGVMIGTSTPLGLTTILATNDEPSLVIRASTGQTANVFVIEKQDGIDIMTGSTNRVLVNTAFEVDKEAIVHQTMTGLNHIVVMHEPDLYHPNRPLPSRSDPTIRVWGLDETDATDYGDFYHNGDDFVIFGERTINFHSQLGEYQFLDGSNTQTIVMRTDKDALKQTTLGLYDVAGNQFIIGRDEHKELNYDHPAFTDPALYINATVSPDSDNTKWMGFRHDQTDGLYDVGSGGFQFRVAELSKATLQATGLTSMVGLRSSGSIQFNDLKSCNLDTDSNGILTCGTDETGGGGGSSEWTDEGDDLRPNELSDGVMIGTSTSLGLTTILLTNDEAGLVVRQMTGQTSDVVVIEQQDGTDIWTAATGGVKVTGAFNVTGEIDLDNYTDCDLKTGAGGNLICGTDAGGSGSPGGSDTQVQFNNSSSFGGISGLTSDGTNVTLTGILDGGGGTLEIPNTTVASLPTATAGRLAIVTDGANDADCTTGSGSTVVLCMANGSTWEPTGDSGAGSDTNSIKEICWPSVSLLPLEAADSVAPLSKDAGTNIDQLTVSFDDSTDECRQGTFKVPDDVASGSTITFDLYWYVDTATTGDVVWDFRHTSGRTEGEDPDNTLTTEAAAADTTQGTAGQLTTTSWTETLANLGWAGGDQVDGLFCRDANNASDTLTGDARATIACVSIPRE